MTARETNLVNAFETTLAAQLASGGSSMNLSDDPGVDAPAYFVIDPDNDSNREIVLWSSGTNHAAATVTRDVDSKHSTDPTHAAGTVVRLAVVKQHIEEAHDAIQQGFILEDDDGTEVTIAPAVASGVYTAREIKFVGDGVDIDWTDTSDGTDGDPYDLTFTLDINDLAAGTVAVANDSIVILDSDDNASKKESIADLISAIDGTGLTASSGVLAVDSSQAITALTGGDLTIYDDQNNADVSVKLGTSATESLTIQVLNGTSNKTAEEIHFSTATASSTANHGKFVFDVDGSDIVTIDDGGIDLASGMTFAINGSDISTTDTTYSAGSLLDLSSTTFNVDLTEAAEAAIADGDYVLFLDGGATGTQSKEAVHDLATLFAGAGLTATSSVIAVDIANATELASGLALTDELLVSDAGTIKRMDISLIADAIDGDGIDVSSGTLVNAAIGKQSIWVPASAMYPSSTNGCSALAQVETTAGRPDLKVLDFADGADSYAQFSLAFPSYWNEGTITFKSYWTVTGTNTGTVQFALEGLAVSSDDTINTAFSNPAVHTALAHSGTSNDLMVSAESGACTVQGSPAAGDNVFFRVTRDISGDTQTGAARLIGLKIFYTVDDVHEA